MNIDINNVRVMLLNTHDSLVKKLNAAILISDQYAKPNDVQHEQDVNICGHILIDAEDIRKEMESLRQFIGAIAMTYEEGDDDFKDVYSEVYPEDKTMKSFYDEEE